MDADRPFTADTYNESYAHLSRSCADEGVSFCIAHPDTLFAPEARAWRYDGSWRIAPLGEIAAIQTRIRGDYPRWADIRELIAQRQIPTLNQVGLDRMVLDKHESYLALREVMIPSKLVISEDDVHEAIAELAHLAGHEDLSMDRIFAKPRFGHAGIGIEVFSPQNAPGSLEGEYVLQPFLESAAGIPEVGIAGRHDLRIIVADGIPVTAYVRLPQSGELLASRDRGSSLRYLDIETLPERALETVRRADAALEQYGERIYALDMARGSSGRFWLIEANGKPSIVWPSEDTVEIAEKRKVHGFLARALGRLANET